MNTYSLTRWILPAALVVCSWSAFGQSVNPTSQINWPLSTGSGAPTSACTAANYGQPYTDVAANKTYVCGSTGWVLSGGGGSVTVTANQGVGANNSAAIAAVPEVNYLTTSGNTAFACQEDQNSGNWDVRCIRGGVSWASNPSQALINTIAAAKCYQFTHSTAQVPIVHLPAGNYSVGGNIGVPAGLDLEGTGGTQYGILTNLFTTDPTQAMFTQQNSMTFNCSGTNYTANQGTSTIGNVSLHGAGSTNAADVGILNNTGSNTNSNIHNISLMNFGGPGRMNTGANGQNSRGSYIFFQSDIQWYYNSGAYNVGGFTDTTPHCALQLLDVDSHWDHIEGYGQLQDSGYYNRYYLCGVQVAPGPTWFTDSWIQINPHDLWVGTTGDDNGGGLIFNNQLDDSWWDAIHIATGSSRVQNNNIVGYCTSPTLNPANFPSNPGGVSTDPNCSGIEFISLGTNTFSNSIGEIGLWPSWPVGAIYAGPNGIGHTPSMINEPGIYPTQILGTIGGDPGNGNPGADAGRVLFTTSSGNNSNVGGTVHFKGYAHTQLADTVATTYNNFDGLVHDTFVSIYVGPNDTITPSAAFITCNNATVGPGTYWFWNVLSGNMLRQMDCGSAGSGGVSGSGTGGYLPLWSGTGTSTALTTSHLDEVSNPGNDTFSQPVIVNDGSGTGGGLQGTEGTAITGASALDSFWADSTAHRWKMNNNNAGAFFIPGIGTAAGANDKVLFAANGIDLVDGGPDPATFTPTFTIDAGAGTGATASFTAGSNDVSGWVNVTTGTSPANSSGVITIKFGGTYSYTPKCFAEGANAVTTALSGTAAIYVPSSTSTSSQFVLNVGFTPLTPATSYQWYYGCSK